MKKTYETELKSNIKAINFFYKNYMKAIPLTKTSQRNPIERITI